jgi:hypothetical protein
VGTAWEWGLRKGGGGLGVSLREMVGSVEGASERGRREGERVKAADEEVSEDRDAKYAVRRSQMPRSVIASRGR